MSIERAQQIVARASAIFDSKQKELLKDILDAVGEAIASSGITIEASDFPGVTPEAGQPISIIVDNSTPGTYILSILGDV